MTKDERLIIVNNIIKEISSLGRRFFSHKGTVAELFIRNGKVWYKCEYIPEGNPRYEICLSIPDYRVPKGWYHGGTLLALVKDFRDFIITGKYSNSNHGYGGLLCTHWGYKEEEMDKIRLKAKELGYLKS